MPQAPVVRMWAIDNIAQYRHSVIYRCGTIMTQSYLNTEKPTHSIEMSVYTFI